jgi:CheY-like chemotaxis protein
VFVADSPKAGGKKKNEPVQIVVVEDNPGDVYLLEQSLRSRDIVCELIVYHDGAQAMRAISESRFAVPDLILVDLNLPHRDGFDVLTTVRQEPQLVDVPVGVLTSSDIVKDRQFTALLGAVRYIHKPRNLEEFNDEVGSAVEELLALSPRRKVTPS